MKESLKKVFRYVAGIKKDDASPFQNISYSQEGEDLILERIFINRETGFFIDIGAHHPFRFSNTYLFYKKGWKGINIDPNPNSKQLFDAMRPRDINVELGISDQKGELNYYNFQEKALNTFSEPLAKQYLDGNWKLENIIKIQTITLAEILNTHLSSNQRIDFMTVDVEGLEKEVLSSNDWAKYKPEMILVEMLDSSINSLSETEIARFLFGLGYFLFAKTFNTVFFKLG
jgi:FkbM family methyltransferase